MTIREKKALIIHTGKKCFNHCYITIEIIKFWGLNQCQLSVLLG